MFSWLYDLPNWGMFLLFVVVALVVCWGSVFLLRPVMDRLLSGTGLFYALLLGLIAAATYTTYSEAEAGVASEATAVSALYRDVSAYPEPLRSQLRGDVENYVDTLINVAWPNRQRGETTSETTDLVDSIQR